MQNDLVVSCTVFAKTQSDGYVIPLKYRLGMRRQEYMPTIIAAITEELGKIYRV